MATTCSERRRRAIVRLPAKCQPSDGEFAHAETWRYDPPVPQAQLDLGRTAEVDARSGAVGVQPLSLPFTLNGRYELREVLGNGGMGVVYGATDRFSGQSLALKTLRGGATNATALALFKAEFMTLAALSHPNIAKVYDFARRQDSTECFFTMERVDGLGVLAATQGATLEEVLRLGTQVLRALSYVHVRGVIHLDLKPANIMVTREGQVRLLDFGVAHSRFSRASGLYGTPLYMAPEVRSDSHEVDRRADLYSFGVTLLQLVSRQVWRDPPPDSLAALLTDARERLPPGLAPILERLLEPDPARRFRTANEVMSALNRARGAEDVIETAQTSESYLASAALVGRESQLSTLHAHVEHGLLRARPWPQAALCVGPSGSGKSRLLRELRQQLQLAHYVVLASDCYPEAHEPYAAWRDLIGQAASRLGGAVGRHSDLLQRLCPEMAARLGLPPQRCALTAPALADAVLSLLAVNAPLVVCIQDVEWLDAASLQLLELVLERCRVGPRELVPAISFVLSARDELPAPVSAALGRLRQAQQLLDVTLPVFDVAQVAELVASMVGATDFPKELAQSLTSATRGNATAVVEVLRSWVRDGRLTPTTSGWMWGAGTTASAITAQLERLWRERLEGLSSSSLRALQILALSGRPLPLHLLAMALELNTDEVLLALTELRERQLVFLSGEELVHMASTRWAETVNEALDPPQRTAVQLRLANALAHSGDAGRAAFHYRQAADLPSAVEQYAHAAGQCFERGELSQVLEHVEHAAACDASPAVLGRLSSVAAQAARLCGDPRAAIFAQRALTLLPVGSGEWLQASRVAIAVSNPFATRT